MSGNMNFSNGNFQRSRISIVDNNTVVASSSRGTLQSDVPRRERVWTSSPIKEQEDESALEDVDLEEINKEFWETKIIMSALEEIVFGPTHYKIHEDLLKLVKATLDHLKIELQTANPFFQETDTAQPSSLLEDIDFSNMNTTASLNVSSISFLGPRNAIIGKNTAGSVMNAMNKMLTFENKTVFRNLISMKIKTLAREIVDIYSPVMHQEPLSESSDDEKIRKALVNVNNYLDNMASDNESNSEMDKLSENIRECKLATFEEEMCQCAMALEDFGNAVKTENDPIQVSNYLDALEKEKEMLELQLQIAEIERVIEANPPALAEMIQQKSICLEKEIKALEKSCAEKEKRIQEYNELGPKFAEYREKYVKQEEEIKVKMWVKEQLLEKKSLTESEAEESFTFS